MVRPVDDGITWVVVVPVKELPLAKTRLHHLGQDDRADLAAAMAADVVDAALHTTAVVGVVVVTNDLRAAADASKAGALVVADGSDSGLDDALRDGVRAAHTLWPRCGVAALSADLPCATAEALAVALHRAGTADRSLLADRVGSGTTMLAARPGIELAPSYGPASRSRHLLAGAVQIDATGLGALTLDVDTPADLAAAIELGVGRRTAAVMLRIGSATGR